MGCDGAEVRQGTALASATSLALGEHGSHAIASASGSLEARAAAAAEPDWTALEACADTATRCFDGPDADAVACLDAYVGCVVDAGVDAAEPGLVCLSTLARCWEGADGDAAADICMVDYEGCVDAIPAPAETEPDEEDLPDERDPESPLEACGLEADACIGALDLDDGPGHAACFGAYAACMVDVGVDPAEPYVGCLAEGAACFEAAGASVDACWEGFAGCVEVAYPAEDPDTHGPDDGAEDDGELALCEAETMSCYDAGGSNPECLGVYATCLGDNGVPADHPYMGCLDALIACSGPAEASEDPETALEACTDTFFTCYDAIADDEPVDD